MRTGSKNRGVNRRGDLLVMNTVKKKYGISHALLETCFIDDLDDMKLYRSVKGKVAKAVAAGIAEGFGLTYTDTSTTPKKEEGKTMTEPEIRKLVTETAKNAAQDVVQSTFTRIYDNANPLYTNADKVPGYWQQEVAEMIRRGAIQGDSVHEISIRHDALQAAVIAYRAAVKIHK